MKIPKIGSKIKYSIEMKVTKLEIDNDNCVMISGDVEVITGHIKGGLQHNIYEIKDLPLSNSFEDKSEWID